MEREWNERDSVVDLKIRQIHLIFPIQYNEAPTVRISYRIHDSYIRIGMMGGNSRYISSCVGLWLAAFLSSFLFFFLFLLLLLHLHLVYCILKPFHSDWWKFFLYMVVDGTQLVQVVNKTFSL